MERPPCWADASDCPNACAGVLHERTIYNRTPLYGPWAGWRMAGRVLVSPDGDRISPERLRGVLFREHSEKRIKRGRHGEVVELDEFRRKLLQLVRTDRR